MIEFNFENDFTFGDTSQAMARITNLIKNEGFEVGEINYIFCDDEYLLAINQQYLNHDYYTDIITFDYTENYTISGDIYISTQRVSENAENHQVDFVHELYRVMYHGILHLCGYKDKTEAEQKQMRSKEDYYLSLHT